MERLLKLVDTIWTHKAIDNNFYTVWLNEELNPEELAIFAINYWQWTYHFPSILAGLISSVNNINVKTEYTKTLYSEMGYGNAEKVHSTLFEVFYDSLISKKNRPDLVLKNIKNKIALSNDTNQLIEWQRDVYSSNTSVAIGAQLALEWQAYTMIRKLYDGARNYSHLWKDPDEFHEDCEFFYVHIGAAEKEHKKESLLAAEELIEDGIKFSDIEFGFNKNLELISCFWEGMIEAINYAEKSTLTEGEKTYS